MESGVSAGRPELGIKLPADLSLCQSHDGNLKSVQNVEPLYSYAVCELIVIAWYDFSMMSSHELRQ